MLQLLLKQRPTGQIGTIKLDATLSYSHDKSNAVSSFPVEKGSPITDHVRNEPLTIRMDGFITNSPIVLYGRQSTIEGDSKFKGDESQSMIDRAFDELNRLDDTREPFTVVTGMQRYDNMVFRTLNIPRNDKTGDALRFTAVMQQIRIIDPKLVTLPNVQTVVKDKATDKVKTGADTASSASPEATKKVSTLKSGLKFLAGI